MDARTSETLAEEGSVKKQTFHLLCFDRRARNGRIVNARVEQEGYAIELFGVSLFAHRYTSSAAWHVSSVECGMMLGTMPTMRGAIDDARREIKKQGLAKVRRTIRRNTAAFRRARIVSATEWDVRFTSRGKWVAA
jgi:hypothetical protein